MVSTTAHRHRVPRRAARACFMPPDPPLGAVGVCCGGSGGPDRAANGAKVLLWGHCHLHSSQGLLSLHSELLPSGCGDTHVSPRVCRQQWQPPSPSPVPPAQRGVAQGARPGPPMLCVTRPCAALRRDPCSSDTVPAVVPGARHMAGKVPRESLVPCMPRSCALIAPGMASSFLGPEESPCLSSPRRYTSCGAATLLV